MSDPAGSASFSSRLAALVRRAAVLAVWTLTAVFLFLKFSPSTAWLPELMRHFVLYLTGGTLLAAVAALAFRQWLHGTAGLLAAAAMAMPVVPYFRAQGEPAVSVYGQGADFTLVTCNLRWTVADPEAMRRVLTDWNPDVLLLEEYTPEWRKLLEPVTSRYPHQTARVMDSPMGIWFGSRLAAEELRVEDVGVSECPAVIAHLKANRRSVRFVGAHTAIPLYPRTAKIWRDQFVELSELVNLELDEARILAGDLNSTPFCLTFASLLQTAGLRDSALGHGVASTWYPRVPSFGLPIDHVLVSPGIEVLEREIGPNTGSDHRPVRVKLRVL